MIDAVTDLGMADGVDVLEGQRGSLKGSLKLAQHIFQRCR